jgi:two-component system, OmpR family, response regulator
LRVLVLDDETFLAELVKLALEADGHVCYAADSIEDAAEVVRSVQLDLVALDLVSGGSEPIAWIEDVVLRYAGLHGRIVVLTAREIGGHDLLRLTACGVRVMAKPFTLHGLRRLVKEIGSVEGGGGIPLPPPRPERPLTDES